mmetsp:Transcript_23410/g.37674  ORF Transcript_23410/g.37674 Transcript_23410/m.37674 type:complete len:849 (+) Transcript_23410:60-2606(+)
MQKKGEAGVAVQFVEAKVKALREKANENQRSSAAAGSFQLPKSRQSGGEVPYLDANAQVWSQFSFNRSELLDDWEQQSSRRKKQARQNAASSLNMSGGRDSPSNMRKEGKRKKKVLPSQDLLRNALELYDNAEESHKGKTAINSILKHRKGHKGAYERARKSMQKFLRMCALGASGTEAQNVRSFRYNGKAPKNVDYRAALRQSLKRANDHLNEVHRKLHEKKLKEVKERVEKEEKLAKIKEERHLDRLKTAEAVGGVAVIRHKYAKEMKTKKRFSRRFSSLCMSNSFMSLQISRLSTPDDSRESSFCTEEEREGGKKSGGSNRVRWDLSASQNRTRVRRATMSSSGSTTPKASGDPILLLPFKELKTQKKWREVLKVRKHLCSQNCYTKQSFFEKHLESPLVVKLTETLSWYFYCRYFQADSEQMQEKLENNIRQYSRALVKQIQPLTMPASQLPTGIGGISRAMQAADTFHHYYPILASDAILAVYRSLFPASHKLLDKALAAQLDLDVYTCLNGTTPEPVLCESIRRFLFPPMESGTKTDDEDEFQFRAPSGSSGEPNTPLEQAREAKREIIRTKGRSQLPAKERFNLHGLSPGISQSLRHAELMADPSFTLTRNANFRPNIPKQQGVDVSEKEPLSDHQVHQKRLELIDGWFQKYEHKYLSTKSAVRHEIPTMLRGPRPTSPQGKIMEPVTLTNVASKDSSIKRYKSLRLTHEAHMARLKEELLDRGLGWIPWDLIVDNEEELLLHDDPSVDILNVLQPNDPSPETTRNSVTPSSRPTSRKPPLSADGYPKMSSIPEGGAAGGGGGEGGRARTPITSGDLSPVSASGSQPRMFDDEGGHLEEKS